MYRAEEAKESGILFGSAGVHLGALVPASISLEQTPLLPAVLCRALSCANNLFLPGAGVKSRVVGNA